MSKFKQVIEVEKKYESTINSAQKRSEKQLAKLKEELIQKEEELKLDLKKQLDLELKEKLEQVKKSGEEQVEKAKQDANAIEARANIDDAKKYLVEEFKTNVI